MKFVSSLILVENIKYSREFYEKILKQKVKYDFGVNVSFEDGFAIHLNEHFQEVAKVKVISKGANNFELYFETENIDGIFEELKSNKVEFLHEIEEQPWGQRVIRFYDPDKHIVEIGEAMESVIFRLNEGGCSRMEIVAKTGMPKEFVDGVLG